ncbi:MAG: hypothetical protein KBG54_05155 [Oscillospiraceae bacterium]|nr:hypothetical protein [Oscillospiraceae bacterium]
METNASLNGQILFCGVLSRARAEEPFTLSGGNITAYMDGLDAFLDAVNDAADQNDTQQLQVLLCSKGANSEGLQEGILVFTRENGAHLLTLPCDSICKTESTITADACGLRLCIYQASANAHTALCSEIDGLESARRMLQMIKASAAQLASQQAVYSAMILRCERTISRIAAMEHNLACGAGRIHDLEMAREFMRYAREQIYAEARLLVEAQGRHRISEVLALLTL